MSALRSTWTTILHADEVDGAYDPSNVVTLSMQRTEQTAGGPPQAAGVPGTASNAPEHQAARVSNFHARNTKRKQESGTYGASKKVRHTTQGTGKIRRVTAAVLINQRMIATASRFAGNRAVPRR